MAYIQKNRDPKTHKVISYTVREEDASGRKLRGTVTFHNSIDAKELRDTLNVARRRRKAGLDPLPRERGRLSEMFSEYLAESKAENDPAWVARKELAFRNFIRYFGDVEPKSIRVKGLRDYRTWMETHGGKNWRRPDKVQGRKAGGIRNELSAVRAAFNWAELEDPPWITSNPFRRLTLPAPGRGGRLLTDSEIKALFAAFPRSALAPTKFLLGSGLRSSELVAADYRWVTKIRVPVKVGDQAVLQTWGQVHVPETKNGQPRDVPLLPAVLALIEPLREKGPLFPGLKRDWLRLAMYRAKKKAGIENVSQHTLRHTWATLMKRLFGKEAVKYWGGWKTDIAAGIYQHDDPGLTFNLKRVASAQLQHSPNDSFAFLQEAERIFDDKTGG